jgi:glycosyltransferase involved in cell wall biosynthesis
MEHPEGGIECVYVDTASSDGSPDRVEALGYTVVRISPESPSAAAARDAGWRAVSAPFVLFVDGDCQMEEHFAVQALRRFDDPRVAVAWGRLRETHPTASIYNRMMHVAWICLRTLPEGDCFYGTGIGIVRRSALEAVNGFNLRMIHGENTEMASRMQKLGYRVLHVALPMVRHDAGMTSLAHYLRRFFRDGYSYARLQEVFRSSNTPLFRFEFSAWFGALMLVGPPVAILASLFFHSWAIAATAALLLTGLILRTAARYRQVASNLSDALLFGLHWHLKLIPNFLGHLAYHSDKRTGKNRGLMDYRRS